MSIVQKILEALNAWSADKGVVEQMILFGSIARGDANQDSDIDIAILYRSEAISGESTDLVREFIELQTEPDTWVDDLEAQLGRKVSLHGWYFSQQLGQSNADLAWTSIFEGLKAPVATIGKAVAIITPPKSPN